MRARREQFIAELVSVTRAEIRSLDDDSRMVELLHASITENVIAAIHFLEYGGDEADVEAPSAALAYARAMAQRDVALSALIRAYRIGHGRFVDQAMALLAAHTPADDALPAARQLVHRAAAWIDRICDQVGVAYEQERDRWVGSRSGLRQHWVNELLAGGAADIAKAEDALDYRLDRSHVAAVMWPDNVVATRDVGDVFDRARSALGRVLGTSETALMVPTDEREVRLWWPIDTIDVATVRSVLEHSDLAVRVAMSGCGHGVEGFRRSLSEAERAKVVALSGGSAVGRLVCYDDVAPVALMATNMPDLRMFVQRTLGALAVDDERSGLLRNTLREFLARNRSFAGTASAMFLHRNTIQYRVAQAMEACSASFDEPDVVVNIQIALTACRWMGPSLLSSSAATR
ncbi:PucR family transcriptional regulator [Mycobacterium kyogaense]|uniref:PucR family transcriptional regulator n=1 Tax=Mycobacterium kyogaense TaxID=2212479 RepID=UPI000DADC82E|nr:helix-turn-helix domain-containing protein [Mycobacterium kyogaense]